MAVKPILFNTEMVKAILDGRKSCTRRLVKNDDNNEYYLYCGNDESTFDDEMNEKKLKGTYATFAGNNNSEEDYPMYKSQYQVGDILWVRETWCRGRIEVGELPDGRDDIPNVSQCAGENDVLYKEQLIREGVCIDECLFRPSIHMPKEAARIFLKETGVRVERLQDITKEEMMNEGIREYTKDGTVCKYAVSSESWNEIHKKYKYDGTSWQTMPREAWKAFAMLWDSTVNKKQLDQYGWDANPYVFVYEFERCEKPEGWCE